MAPDERPGHRREAKTQAFPPRDQSRPAIVLVDDDSEWLERLKRRLETRYGTDYQILAYNAPWSALQALESMGGDGQEIALVMAAQWMAEMNGVEFLSRIHALFRETKRALLVEMGDSSVAEPILRAMALGRIEGYLVKVIRERDEAFHRLITDLLEEWSRGHEPLETVKIVGERWAPASHQLRDLLDRNAVGYGFYDQHSVQGRNLLEAHGQEEGPFPVVILYDGRVLNAPSMTQIADQFTARPHLGGEPLDVVIVGGGPAGLSAAVYAASEGLRVLIVEREAFGGQAGTSSLIRNYLGFPRGISGNELAERAYQQAWLFGAEFILMREVVELRTKADGLKRLLLSDNSELLARSVVIATGVRYRRLGVTSLEAFLGAGVFYGAGRSEARAMDGQQVYLVGAGNSAGQSALFLARFAEKVTILVRGGGLSKSMSEYLVREIADTPNIRVLTHTEAAGGAGKGHLEALSLRNSRTDHEETVPASALFVLIGAVPHTDWLTETLARNDRGYLLTGPWAATVRTPPLPWPLPRRPLRYETSVPGVFAIGDVRAGSIKRVAAAAGEGAIAVQLMHNYLSEQAIRRGSL